MSRRANPTLVGLFVVGAIVLVLAAALAFGGSALLRARPEAVAYFEGSVSGLNVGAPVTWRGVRIGSVKEVRIDLDATSRVARIPVFMEFDPEKVNFVAGTHELRIRELVRNGLRAQLQLQSFVTGQLFVELEMHPETPVKLVGPNLTLVPEVPTMRSGFDVLKEALERLPLQELGQTAIHTLASIDQLASAPEIKTLLLDLATSAQEMGDLLKDIHAQVPPMASSVISASDSVRDTFKDAQEVEGDMRKTLATVGKTADTANSQVAQVGADLHNALAAADQSLRASQAALASMNSLLAANSPQRADINELMRNLAIASESLRGFVDQINRNPNALLLGKK